MQPNFPLFPEQASTIAKHVDALYLFLVLITTFFSLLVGLLIVFFAVKYRKTPNRTSDQIHASMFLELVCTAIPLALSIVICVCAAFLDYQSHPPPKHSMEVAVVR